MKKWIAKKVIFLFFMIFFVVGAMTVSHAAEIPCYQVESRLENDRQMLSAASQCLREGKSEGEFLIVGRDYMPEGTILRTFYGDALEYSSTVQEVFVEGEELWRKVRFAVRWKDGMYGGEADDAGSSSQENGNQNSGNSDSEGQGKRYWRLGDTVTREIAGETYTFRCIDQNYRSSGSAQQAAALFLCDSVIPADIGSYYSYKKLEDGGYDYVFYPGPIVDFGDTGEYKYSRVRQWLNMAAAEWTEDSGGADTVASVDGVVEPVWIDIGISRSYTGQTTVGSFDQLQERELRAYGLGHQLMTDCLFILSVEEALKYRQYLWRFAVMPEEGEENPEDQIGAFSKGYWLRTPVGDGTEKSGQAYIVDLVNGQLRPQQVTFDRDSGMEAMSVGIRPVFALPQQN